MPFIITPRQMDAARSFGVTDMWVPSKVQEFALRRTEYEILLGGARGGGKTACGIVWLVSGNPDSLVEEASSVDLSYVNHPNYRALVLRRNLNDMEDWIRKAREIYAKLGGEFTARPAQFVWPNLRNPKLPGATIVVNHLDSDDAFEKYQGQEFQRILLEEATQIASYELYSKVLASCRTVYPELRPQAFLTCNPGGAGNVWVRDRFVYPLGPDGKPFPWKTVITWDPTLRDSRGDTLCGTQRIFIPALPADNTFMCEHDPLYVTRLEQTLSPALRRAWIYGDWNSLGGTMYPEFRPDGPIGDDPSNARHVIDPVPLSDWWPRWVGCDWGYSHNSAAYLAVQHPNGQVHITRELVRNRLTPDELGSEIAKWLGDDAARGITVWLAHDAFQRRTDVRTIADQIAAGIETVYGPDSVYIPSITGSAEEPSFYSRRELQQGARVTLQRAERHRVAGWQYLHSLMRWWTLTPEASIRMDPAYAVSLLQQDDGYAKYTKYLRECNAKPETLPVLQIWRAACPQLIVALPKLQQNNSTKGGDIEDADDRHFDGLDSVDALRYTAMAHSKYKPIAPASEFVDERLQRYAANADGTTRAYVADKALADYNALHGTGGFTLNRRPNRLQ